MRITRVVIEGGWLRNGVQYHSFAHLVAGRADAIKAGRRWNGESHHELIIVIFVADCCGDGSRNVTQIVAASSTSVLLSPRSSSSSWFVAGFGVSNSVVVDGSMLSSSSSGASSTSMSLRMFDPFQKPKSFTDRPSFHRIIIVDVDVDADTNTPFGHTDVIGRSLVSTEPHYYEALVLFGGSKWRPNLVDDAGRYLLNIVSQCMLHQFIDDDRMHGEGPERRNVGFRISDFSLSPLSFPRDFRHRFSSCRLSSVRRCCPLQASERRTETLG